MQWEGGVLPHKTTGTTDEEDILFHLVNIYSSLRSFDQRVTAHARVIIYCARFQSFPSFDKMAAAQDSVIVIMNDGHYQSEMTKAGAKLVVVDFTASWWVTVVKFIDQINAFQDRMVVAILIRRTPLVHRSLFSTILINSDTLFTVKLS